MKKEIENLLINSAIEMSKGETLASRVFHVDFQDSYSCPDDSLLVRSNDFFQCKCLVSFYQDFLEDIGASPMTKHEFTTLISKGLISFISICKSAIEIISDSGDTWDNISSQYANADYVMWNQCAARWVKLQPFFRYLISDIVKNGCHIPMRSTLMGDEDDEFHDPYNDCPDCDNMYGGYIHIFYCFCKFGTRFAYIGLDLSRPTIDKWLSINHAGYESNLYHSCWYDHVTSIMMRIYTAIWNTFKDLDIKDGVYTGPGSSLEGRLPVADKYVIAASYADGFNYSQISAGIPMIRISETAWWRTLMHDYEMRFRTCCMSTPLDYNGHPKDRMARFNKLTVVPKNSTSGRLVAPESINHINYGRNISLWIEEVVGRISPHITSKSQYYNRMMASLVDDQGFVFATIDSTSSSDTIYLSDVYNVMPTEMVEFITQYRSEFTKINKYVTKINCLFTMGCPECFSFQLMWYLVVAITARYICSHFDQRGEGYRFNTLDIFDMTDSEVIELCRELSHTIGVFGDDLIVPDEDYDSVIGLLKTLHQIPNTSKSYHGRRNFIFSLDDGRSFDLFDFRESCGAEFLYPFKLDSDSANDCSVKLITPVFYPRGGFDFIKETGSAINSLISLQHRVCQVFPTFSSFLESTVRQLIPGITSSFTGSIYNDLWDDVEVTTKSPVPFAEKGIVDRGYFESCDGLEWLGRVCPTRYIFEYRDSKGLLWDISHRDHWSIALEGEVCTQPDIVEFYLYYYFLEHGPVYRSPLDQLLGVSTQMSRTDVAKIVSKADFKIIRAD